MAKPTEPLNARIAILEGWIRLEPPLLIDAARGRYALWQDPKGIHRSHYDLPDYVGTLKGVAGLLWELGPEWTLHPDPPDGWLIWRDRFEGGVSQTFHSPREKLGDCVGRAWIAIKEAADASTE